MVLKIQSLVMVSLLVMLFLGIVHGEEIPGVYIPDTVNRENPNLLIGGIRQISSDPNKNTEKEIAEKFGAIYVPTYYSGPAKDQADELIKIAGDAIEVNKAASCAKWHEATYLNGLSSDALKGPKTYNTIVAYSGGTVSAVTALDKQDVRCHTLILISPMIGMVPATTASFYKQQIKRLLESGAVQRIVVIQSSDDQPPADNLYEAKFTKGEISGVDVYDVDLKTTGIEAHKEIFYEYAKDHLKLNKKNGRVNYVPDGMDSNSPSVQAFQITPLSLTIGESFTVDYMVSDNDGSDLKQVELWRKDEQSDWQEIKRDEISSENGPTSGSFRDSPSAPGKYWYGLHVVDNAGNWNDEKNSNTNNPSVSFGPIEVEIKKAQGSGSSVVGKWEVYQDWGNTCQFMQPSGPMTITFNEDGTLTGYDDVHTGNWVQSGDTISWQFDYDRLREGMDVLSEVKAVFEGIVKTNTLDGVITCKVPMIIYGVERCSTGRWNAARIDA